MKYIKIVLVSLLLLVGCSSEKEFSYSGIFSDEGFYKKYTASEYVESIDFSNLDIPDAVLNITQEDIDKVLSSIFTYFPPEAKEIKEGVIKNGDTVNIDYVGSVDGVEFDGGNTQGNGTSVTIGVTSYIDDFLEQLIGHSPSETINIDVTFPDNYQEATLQGKEARFVTTINYIEEPIIDDAYVKENLSKDYQWTTVDEMNAGIKEQLLRASLNDYIYTYMIDEVTYEDIPQDLIDFQKDVMVDYYTQYAAQSEITLDELIDQYLGLESLDELVELESENFDANAKYSLVSLAIAEKEGFTVSDDVIPDYFVEGTDIDALKEEYGVAYLKHMILCDMVMEHVVSQYIN